MSNDLFSRRTFLKTAGVATAASLLPVGCSRTTPTRSSPPANTGKESEPADYTLRIAVTPVDIGSGRIVSVTTYNGQFPGPLLRFKEGKQVTVDIHNDTDTPEQLHWHGQIVPSDVDGAAEEGTPFIPPHGMRRVTFTPRPAGFRFYHTHVRAGANLSAGQYSGLVGPVYIEPSQQPGNYDQEVFLVLKEFEPTFSRGEDMAQDFLAPSTTVSELKVQGEIAMKGSLAKGMPHGFEVGYGSCTINGRMLGQGQPVQVKEGQRVLFHILNGSATEIRGLALPGHTFRVIAMDGNPVPNPTTVPVLWIGTAERISAIAEMNRPGVWIFGDVGDDDRNRGMGVVVEYAGRRGKPQWIAAPHFRWDYSTFTAAGTSASEPDQTFEMMFAKDNAADRGFNRWTINGVAYPNSQMMAAPSHHLELGKRYRIKMRNASDDIHPIHLHRHTFELTSYAGKSMSGLMKDVIMLGGYQEAEIDFFANNPGMTLFHCHQQLHMDFGFMTLFDYA
jgi:FtsP/CotA-like multicopper oxidase with cupredoxin domain